MVARSNAAHKLLAAGSFISAAATARSAKSFVASPKRLSRQQIQILGNAKEAPETLGQVAEGQWRQR
jgi:hypothetical protein